MNSIELTATEPRKPKTTGRVNWRSSTPLSINDCRALSPAIFAESKHESRSDRYTYIPTTDMLEALMKEGFHPFSISQGGSRKEGKVAFTKHLIRLRHESTSLMTGGVQPEVVLLNSHDGTSSYQLSSGLFKVACANGLIVASSMFDSVRVLHKGEVLERVVNGCKELLGNFPKVEEQITRFMGIPMSLESQVQFASKCLVARYTDPATCPPIDPRQLLIIKRPEDEEPTLWNVLNRVQEQLIMGGAGYVHTSTRGRTTHRRMRSLKGIDSNMAANRAIWQIAEDFADSLSGVIAMAS